MKYINTLIDKINGVDTDIMNKIQSGEIKVEIQDNTYIISQWGRTFDIKKLKSGSSLFEDYETIYLYNGTNLDAIGRDGKNLLKIIKSYQKLIEQNQKNKHENKMQWIKSELKNLFTQAPIVTKNNNTYTLTFWDTVFDVLKSWGGEWSSGRDYSPTYLHNGINLNQLWHEGKQILKIIKKHDIK